MMVRPLFMPFVSSTTTTKVLIIVTLHKVAVALYISDLKNDGSSQKSVVRQLKQMGLCLPSKRQQRPGGPDLCWQTVPRPRRCHRKGAVAKSYTTSWRHHIVDTCLSCILMCQCITYNRILVMSV